MSSARAWYLAVALAALAVPPGCGSGSSPPRTYVLGEADDTVAKTEPRLHMPIVEVRPVRVPDFLDTTDIVTRGTGGEIIASQNGRWGERLSVGLTRAIRARMARRLPGLAVTTAARWADPRWQVAVDIEGLDVRPGTDSDLAATWTIIDATRHVPVAEEHVVLRQRGTFREDTEIVEAMQRQVDDLATRVANALAPIARASPPAGREPGSASSPNMKAAMKAE
jgi:uncharacterized lipoprotein YmbA